jgi:pentatricopeptide repeat protein
VSQLPKQKTNKQKLKIIIFLTVEFQRSKISSKIEKQKKKQENNEMMLLLRRNRSLQTSMRVTRLGSGTRTFMKRRCVRMHTTSMSKAKPKSTTAKLATAAMKAPKDGYSMSQVHSFVSNKCHGSARQLVRLLLIGRRAARLKKEHGHRNNSNSLRPLFRDRATVFPSNALEWSGFVASLALYDAADANVRRQAFNVCVDLPKSRGIYWRMVAAACWSEDWSLLLSILDCVARENDSSNKLCDGVLKHALEACCARFSHETALAVLDRFESCSAIGPPPLSTYRIVLKMYASAHMPKEISVFVRNIVPEYCRTREFYHRALTCAFRHHRHDEFMRLAHHMLSASVMPDRAVFALIFRNDWRDVHIANDTLVAFHRWIDAASERPRTLSVRCYNDLLRALLESGRTVDAIELYEHLVTFASDASAAAITVAATSVMLEPDMATFEVAIEVHSMHYVREHERMRAAVFPVAVHAHQERVVRRARLARDHNGNFGNTRLLADDDSGGGGDDSDDDGFRRAYDVFGDDDSTEFDDDGGGLCDVEDRMLASHEHSMTSAANAISAGVDTMHAAESRVRLLDDDEREQLVARGTYELRSWLGQALGDVYANVLATCGGETPPSRVRVAVVEALSQAGDFDAVRNFYAVQLDRGADESQSTDFFNSVLAAASQMRDTEFASVVLGDMCAHNAPPNALTCTSVATMAALDDGGGTALLSRLDALAERLSGDNVRPSAASLNRLRKDAKSPPVPFDRLDEYLRATAATSNADDAMQMYASLIDGYCARAELPAAVTVVDFVLDQYDTLAERHPLRLGAALFRDPIKKVAPARARMQLKTLRELALGTITEQAYLSEPGALTQQHADEAASPQRNDNDEGKDSDVDDCAATSLPVRLPVQLVLNMLRASTLASKRSSHLPAIATNRSNRVRQLRLWLLMRAVDKRAIAAHATGKNRQAYPGRAYFAMADAALASGDLDHAAVVLHLMATQRRFGTGSKYAAAVRRRFNTLLERHSRRLGGAERVLAVLGTMREAGVEPNVSTYSSAIQAFARAKDTEAVATLLEEAEGMTWSLPINCYNVVLKYVDMDFALDLFHSMRTRLPHAAVAPANAEDVRRELIKRGKTPHDARVAPDAFSYSTIMTRFAMHGSFNTVNDLLDEMREHGVPRDAILYASLLHAAFQVDEIEQARFLYNNMLDDGIPPNPVTGNVIKQHFETIRHFIDRRFSG